MQMHCDEQPNIVYGEIDFEFYLPTHIRRFPDLEGTIFRKIIENKILTIVSNKK